MATINVSGIELGSNCFSNTNVIHVDMNYVSVENNSMCVFLDVDNKTADGVFAQCSDLSSVININNSVTNMSGAFYLCSKMVNAPVIPNSVTTLAGAFPGCYSLVNAPVIPNSVTNVAGAFCLCQKLVNAPVIPNSVTDMKFAFQHCWDLVNSPDMSNANSVTNMSYAFSWSNNLVNAPVIPNSVTDMSYTFSNCVNLTGDISIKSEIVSNAYRCFMNTSLNKNAYIPFTYVNGVNSLTYNSFTSVGYSQTVKQDGVLLKDIYTLLKRLVVLQETSEGHDTPSFWSDDNENFEIGSSLSEGTWKACWGNGRYVAVKRNSNVGAYSIDGKHWYEITLPVSGYWNAIAYGAGVFVATSLQSADIIYSTDGITWTSATTPSGWSFGGAIVFGSTHFVVGDVNHTKYMTSTDGINWTMGVTAARLPYIGYNHNTGVMMSYGWKSTDDGLTWTSMAKPSDYSVGSYKGIYEFGNDFVAIKRNTNGFLVYFEDMSEWVNIGGLEVYPDSYVSTGSNSGIFLDTSNKLLVVDDIENFSTNVVELEGATQINTLIYSKE